MVQPSVAVLERHMLLYRRLWKASVFSFFALPYLFLVSIGAGVGGYVGEVDGFAYLDWIAPGILAATVYQIAANESTYGVYTDFEWVGGFHTMRGTRVSIRDMIAGWLMYVLVMVTMAVVAFLAIAWVFGTLHSPWVWTVPLICALLALGAAGPTMAFAACIRNDGYFELLTRFVVIPTTLFAGVFFPVSELPEGFRQLAYASPLWHGVELSRGAMLGTSPAWPVAWHIGYLLLWAVAGWICAEVAFRRRLAS
ncbi:ABC transporter permease [Streptomyces uncialis]|uniref:Transport permease protein n=1 Tax=Streptomyces uncialis TaxID=1048205 RepID=A0A1Q4VAD5_9ACTN|nr:ABC transporter permease [Streptomyces uncialis]OKH94818.1 ABC transporter [Streptomyces uncialis]